MTKTNIVNKQWINTEEAAQFLGVTTRTIANYRERGLIPFAQVGRVIRYRREDLNRFLMEHYVKPLNQFR
jgi:excisionase family DNA binding protein